MEFQKVIEFQWDEGRTQNRKSNSSADEKVQFQQDQHEASEFHIIGWQYYRLNNSALLLGHK